ncbi:FtsX-like permease family protein [Actinoplanes sp. NPDC049802]|uniref:FtsX-like permease family protein n=1 Tax=Actinoplanes sp. NPDC049802 TaxID=3154742 RepID=UPI0033EFA6A1
MLGLLGRRAGSQWPLLAALLAVVTAGAALLGVCALLVTVSADRAREKAAAAATPTRTEVTGYAVTIARPDVPAVAADTERVLTEALAPFAVSTVGRASAVMRPMSGDAVGYLSGVQDLPKRATLMSGRWPGTGGEAVVLETTARLLRLSPGDTVALGAEQVRDPAPPATVTITGVVRALPGAGWDRDLLGGAGYDLAYRGAGALQPAKAYGPFLVGYRELLSGTAALSRLEITAHPDLSDPDHHALARVESSILEADRRLAAALGERVQIERVGSRLPGTLAEARHQQQVTTAAVLAVAVLGTALTVAALALAGRLTADVRSGETALLSAMGASRWQLAGVAAAEAGLLALTATLLAVPLSSAVHRWISGDTLTVTGAQAAAVTGGALLAVFAIRTAPPPTGERDRRTLLARSGADVLLVALAAAGWWQLDAQPDTAQTEVDAVRILSPALILAAGCAVALRLVPPALTVADRLVHRTRGLPMPLAVVQAARRPTAAAMLIALGCAAATFGVAFDATWQRSQRDQADLSVGTDLAIALGGPPATGQGAVLQAAVGGTVAPTTNRGVAVGQWLGGNGEPPRLVAVDGHRTGTLLRGGGEDWSAVGARLVPATAAAGIAVPNGSRITVTGHATGTAPIATSPRLILEDPTGLRTACSGAATPLDGRPHELPGCATADGLRLVAVLLPVTSDAIGWDATGDSRIDVTVTVPGAAAGGTWTAASSQPFPEQLQAPAVAVSGATLRMTATVELGGPAEAGRQLVATAFTDPGAVPVAVSRRLAEQLSVSPGSTLQVTVGNTPVPVQVVTIVPGVPSAPGSVAILADLDTISRALLVRGDPQLPVDAWWVADPSNASAAAGLHLGEISTRTGEAARLTTGPVPAGLPDALRLLVPAAILLLLAGVTLHVTCDLHARAVEVARLRGLGMTRREIRTTLLGQHTIVMVPVLAAGAVVGALATWVVAPLMIRSETGAAPVPAVAPVWPWPAELAVLAALAAGCLLAVTTVVAVQSRRADAAHLRVTS